MDEMIKFWLIDLYQKEIEETNENIRNHKLWLLGAKDEEEEQMEKENIARLYEYIEVLEELKGELL